MGSFGNKESKLVLVVVVCFFSLKAIVIILIWSRGLTGGERTVKRLRLSKALTVPATTTIYEACKRMASRKVDALLLTDSNEMLCGILTDKVKFENTTIVVVPMHRFLLGVFFISGHSYKSDLTGD